MPPLTGIGTSHDYSLEAIDAAGVSVVLVGVQGDPSFGERLPSQRDVVDIFVRGLYQDSVPNQEQPEEVGWSALECAETKTFCDWVLFLSAVLPSDVSGTGAKQLKLRVTYAPPGGTPRVWEWAKARFKVTPAGGVPSTVAISATCWTRTET